MKKQLKEDRLKVRKAQKMLKKQSKVFKLYYRIGGTVRKLSFEGQPYTFTSIMQNWGAFKKSYEDTDDLGAFSIQSEVFKLIVGEMGLKGHKAVIIYYNDTPFVQLIDGDAAKKLADETEEANKETKTEEIVDEKV